MRRALFLALIVAVAVSGCRKKSSAEFYDAQSTYTGLVDRLGDEAYLDDEMERVKTLLAAVPPNAQESAEARQLLAKITAESARVATAQNDAVDAVERAGVPSVAPPFVDFGEAPGEGAPAVAADAGAAAGPQRPRPGMSEEDFKAAFGDCVSGSAPAALPGIAEQGIAWAVKADEACEKRLGVGPGTSYAFVKGILRGVLQHSQSETRETVDAGPAKPPPPPPPPSLPGFPAPGSEDEAPPAPEAPLPTPGEQYAPPAAPEGTPPPPTY